MIILTNQQARRFILLKQGLLGEHKFIDKQGALDFIRQAGCVQFDPVDLCGKNAEIVLNARVKNFRKDMLRELLYEDRVLFDYPDKQLSIIPIEYWAYFERFREIARANLNHHPDVEEHIETVRKHIEENGAVCSNDIALEGSTSWRSAINWSAGGKLSRSVLEQMYSSGDLVVHHKRGTRRYYDLAERHIPSDILSACEPLPDDFEHLKWRVLRRVGAIGLLWNRVSDAWLNIAGLTTDNRNRAFEELAAEGKIVELCVEGIKSRFYARAEDIELVREVVNGLESKPRCEFIAPLDMLIWDRKLIKALFDFEYGWEIYTPPQKRKYGAYVLPILYGERFVGRIEAVCERDRGVLVVRNVWYDDGVRVTKALEKAIDSCLERFAGFNGCVVEKIL